MLEINLFTNFAIMLEFNLVFIDGEKLCEIFTFFKRLLDKSRIDFKYKEKNPTHSKEV